MNILQINSSIHGDSAASSQIAAAITTQLNGLVTVRELGTNPLPHLDAATFAAFGGNTDTPATGTTLALSDTLIEELRAADVVVLAVPMYNFGIPSSLKAWIDHIARAGVTFRYTSDGPQGLLGSKRVIVVASRGGQYAGTDSDNQSAYLKQVLNFVGLGDPEFVYAEGLANPDRREQVLAELLGDAARIAA